MYAQYEHRRDGKQVAELQAKLEYSPAREAKKT